MKILIPVLGFGKAGGYRVLSILASEMVSKGHEVDLLSPMQAEPLYYPTKANVIFTTTSGKLYKDVVVSKTVIGFIRIMVALFNGIKVLKKNNYDVVLANHSLTTFPVLFSGLKAKPFYYIQAYEPEMYQLKKGLNNIVLKLLSQKSYSFNFKHIVNSHLYANYRGIQNAPVVYPGVDLSIFYPKSKSRVDNTSWTIGTIGRTEPEKGTKFIIDAFKLISRKYNNVQFVIAFGEDEYCDLNINYVQPNGDKALAQFYRDIDVYISAGTIQHGAVHYPVIESMASGTSVITTNYYPATTHNAYIVDSGNDLAIVKAFDNLVANRTERLARIEAGIKSVQSFSWDKVSDKMIEILSTKD